MPSPLIIRWPWNITKSTLPHTPEPESIDALDLPRVDIYSQLASSLPPLHRALPLRASVPAHPTVRGVAADAPSSALALERLTAGVRSECSISIDRRFKALVPSGLRYSARDTVKLKSNKLARRAPISPIHVLDHNHPCTAHAAHRRACVPGAPTKNMYQLGAS
jgi:hypothetical protein